MRDHWRIKRQRSRDRQVICGVALVAVESCSCHCGAMRSRDLGTRDANRNRRPPARIAAEGYRTIHLELCNGLDEVLPDAQFFLYTPRSLNLPRISNRWSFRVDESPFRRLPSNLWLVLEPAD